MMAGEWRIKQYAPTAKTGTRVEVVPDTANVDITPNGLKFDYPNGILVIYPWASIVKAEYVPDNDE